MGSRNFNLDKKSVTRSEPDVVEPVRESRARASKRKAVSIIASFSNVSDSNSETDDESALLKKRKSQQEGRTTTAGESDVQMDVDYEPEPSEIPSTSSFYFTKESNIQLSEDEEIFESRAKSKSPETFQPRRITPPKPGTNKAKRGRGGRTSFKGPRAKKSTGNASKTPNTEALPSKRLPPQEIVLDNDNVEFDDLSKPPNMKMLKIPLKEKTKIAQQKLEEFNNQKRQRIDQKKFYDNMLEESKEKEWAERRRKRLEEEEKTKKLAKEKEEKEKEKKKVWNNFLNNSVKQKREKPKGLSEEEIRRRLEEDDVVVCVSMI